MHHDKPGWAEYMLLVILGSLLGLAALLLFGQAIRPQPIYLSGLTVDRLSATMTLLVSGIGTVVYRFALRYLDGERGQRRFLRWLAFTVGMAYLLMLATHLVLLFAAWALMSLGLHRLLTFYGQRREAQRPARKKFLISRIGDLALLAAISLIWTQWHTLDLHVFLAQVTAPSGAHSATAVALLIVAAALTKSAQFPFHSWLPETMESPTPVSALMHAGIINAGGVLLLRFAPLLTLVPAALLLLVVVGTLTAALGTLAMWAQTDIKRTLAWSTVSQMGFMMVQCGLAVFPAAALHIVGHGCYKAWSFLRSGQLPGPSPVYRAATPQRTLLLAALGVALALPALALASALTGFDPTHAPGELALTAVVALSVGQMWVALFRAPLATGGAALRRAGGGLLLTVLVSGAAFALYHGAALFLAPVFGALPIAHGALSWVAAVGPVVVFAALVVTHALLPTLGRSDAGRAFHIHALHGFYLGAYANRLVDRLWKSTAPLQAAPSIEVQPSFGRGESNHV